MLRDIIGDTLKYIPSVIGPAILGILTVILVSKAFDPSQYGSYILVLTTVNVAGIVSYYWLDSAIIRYLPHYINEESEFYGAVLALAMISVSVSGLLFGVSLFVLKGRMDNNLYSAMSVGLLLFSIMLFYDVGLTVLKAKRLIKIYTYFYIWRWATPLLFGLTIVYFYNWNIVSLLWGTVIGLLAAIPFLYFIVFKHLSFPFNKKYYDIMSTIVWFGLPLIPTNIVIWVLRFSDRYFLEVYKGSDDVGLYSIGYDISEKTLGFITMLFSIASNPVLVHAWEKNSKESVEALIHTLIRYYIIVSLPFVVLVSVLSETILVLFTQPSYLAAWKIVPFVALAAFISGFQWFVQRCLMLVNKTVFIMYAFLVSSALNIILNILLIPKYGFVAAGITTLISYILLLVVMIIMTKRHFKITMPNRTLMNCMISVVPMFLAVIFIKSLIPNHLISLFVAASLLGLGTYVFCIIKVKEFSSYEYIKMKQLFSNHFSL